MPKSLAGVSFWGAVGVVMTALHLKDRFDDYERVPTDPETGRIALVEDDDITLHSQPLLDTEIPQRVRAKRRERRPCCACCSPKCGLFWKAFGIVLGLFFVYQLVNLTIWAITPTPSGLEGLPSFRSSLSCKDAPFIYTDSMVLYSIPMGTDEADHAMNIRGSAVGSVILIRGAEDATEIKYEMTVRANKQADLSDITVTAPAQDPEHPEAFNSKFTLSTPYLSEPDSCMNFAMTVFVPPGLKQLEIEAHTLTHIQFDQGAQLELDKLTVIMSSPDENNLFLPNTGIRAKATTFEVYNGWLVGEASVVDALTVDTKQGSAVTNLRVMPESSSDLVSTVLLQTVSGSGRTDITYINASLDPHRPISSTHRSLGPGDVYLNYQGAEFSGQVDLTNVRSWSASGLRGGERLNDPRWVGDKDGVDRITASSKGWMKLNF
jgi:hypothetical protein